MALTLDELDGQYEVTSEAVTGPHVPNGDGVTEIQNGLTFRKDRNGMIWESAFTILGPAQVAMESTVDPSHAANAAYLRDVQGNPTTAMLTYRTVLDVTWPGGGLVLSGVIEHGPEKIRLTMKKI